jgi:hypothetical protein
VADSEARLNRTGRFLSISTSSKILAKEEMVSAVGIEPTTY